MLAFGVLSDKIGRKWGTYLFAFCISIRVTRDYSPIDESRLYVCSRVVRHAHRHRHHLRLYRAFG
jgi:hypothetical protein